MLLESMLGVLHALSLARLAGELVFETEPLLNDVCNKSFPFIQQVLVN